MKREGFGTRLGFILVSAGCAIGLGNVWRFPFITGQYGGGWFVLFYLVFLLIMGVPILSMELAVGRASRQSATMAFKKLEKPGTKWHLHGWACLLGNYLLMMYYTTVAGWLVAYFFKFATGSFQPGMTTDQVGQVFNSLLASPLEMTFWMGLTVLLGFFVCSKGLENGIEKITTVMMFALLVLILVLAVHSILLPGGGDGLKFFLVPSLERVQASGLANTITAAMNQAFFTLSVGIGSMAIFGSYMSKENTLAKEAAVVCGLDTFVAIMAGLIIFPACFAYGVTPDQGPSLIFLTLPNVFINMGAGRVWGSLFFLFMTFASFSTVIAVFENLISMLMDYFGISRGRSVLINLILVFFGSLPCVLGHNLWKDLHLIRGMDVLGSEDFLVSNLLLPVGSLIYLLFCVSRYGWGFDNYLEECNQGEGLCISPRLRPYFTYVLPLLILLILANGLI